jgi:hypothetical protein
MNNLFENPVNFPKLPRLGDDVGQTHNPFEGMPVDSLPQRPERTTPNLAPISHARAAGIAFRGDDPPGHGLPPRLAALAKAVTQTVVRRNATPKRRGEYGDRLRCRPYTMSRIVLRPSPALSPYSPPCQRRGCEK